MSTRKVLEEMLENCLGAAYQEVIRQRYQRNVEEGNYEIEERWLLSLPLRLSPESADQ